jgi:predicted enzyme related to lactoylglutathione lyase
MSGPARAGLSIYAKDKQRIASFYEAILGMSVVHQTNDVTVLQSPDIQFVVHRIPEDRSSNVVIETPPKLRNSALKFFFTVSSIEAARPVAQELGGDIGVEKWQGPGFIVCNGHDPEGNVFHVRETLA